MSQAEASDASAMSATSARINQLSAFVASQANIVLRHLLDGLTVPGGERSLGVRVTPRALQTDYGSKADT